MIHINLLPVRQIKQKLAAKQQLATALVTLLVLLMVLAVIGFFQASRANQLNNDINRLNKEKQRHTQTLNMIKQLQKNKALIEKRITIIDKLKKTSSLTVRVLDEVAKATPFERVWLQSVSQDRGGLKLSGMALDNRTIAQYMDDLKASPYITTVNLANSSQKSYAKRNLKSFSISCSIGVPEEKKTNNTQEK